MVDAFQELSFLTRSENRVEVLETLAGNSYSERELVAETGISDVTVKRVLGDFLDRHWITQEAESYTATALGSLVAGDYRQLEDSMSLAARLGPIFEHLPVEEMDFDLGLLRGARISDPDTFEPIRAVDRWKQLIRESDHVVGIAPATTASTVVAEPYHEEVTAGNLKFEVVVSTEYVKTAIQRAEMRELLRDQISAGAAFYRAPPEASPLPLIATFDDLATISAYDDSGTIQGGIETEADPVFDWIHDRFAHYRERATPLAPDDFSS